jgi:hypothetical protein
MGGFEWAMLIMISATPGGYPEVESACSMFLVESRILDS